MSSGWKVVEKKNHNAVHLLTWSRQRGLDWIEEYGDSKMFDDKTITKDSFEVISEKENSNEQSITASKKDNR